MGVKNADGSICYIIGVRKDIRGKIGKQVGDRIANHTGTVRGFKFSLLPRETKL